MNDEKPFNYIYFDKPKSTMKIGSLEIHNTKHFNWLNKMMFKIFFGVEIKDYKEDK